MLECVLIRSQPRGFSREPGQDHRYHDNRHSQYSALRPLFRLAERLMLRIAVLILFLACLAAAVPPNSVFAQQSTDDDDVVRVNTDLLLFPGRIRDKKGQAVVGLTEQDLTLKDQDQVTTGVYFARGADRVAMLFALDQSGILPHVIPEQQEAALSLFSRFSDRSTVAVLRFSDKPPLATPFTKDVDAARAAFRFGIERDRRTAIFDAAAEAVRAVAKLPTVRAERRIIVLISDGLDNNSATRPDSVIDAALERRVSFYVIHLPLFTPQDGHLAVRPRIKACRELAERTG